MALPSILIPRVQREIWREIPDARYLPYGGYFGSRVPDKPRSRNWLAELDVQLTTAANIVASGSLNTPASRKPNQVIGNKSVQIVRSERVEPKDLEWLGLLGDNPGPAAKAAVKDWVQQAQGRNGEGVRITRGYLIACGLVGTINWNYLGIALPNVSFRMPSQLQLVPAKFDRNADGTTYAAALPITNVTEADYQSTLLSGTPFDMIGMSRGAKIAMLGTTQYQQMAMASSAVYRVTSLPIVNTPQADALMSATLGKEIVNLDQTFQLENPAGGNPTTVRYIPENLTVLWHKADEGSDANWEFSNVPLEKALIAEAMGDTTFEGTDGFGPLPFAGGDRVEFTWASQYVAQEGVFTRKVRTVSATIQNMGANS